MNTLLNFLTSKSSTSSMNHSFPFASWDHAFLPFHFLLDHFVQALSFLLYWRVLQYSRTLFSDYIFVFSMCSFPWLPHPLFRVKYDPSGVSDHQIYVSISESCWGAAVYTHPHLDVLWASQVQRGETNSAFFPKTSPPTLFFPWCFPFQKHHLDAPTPKTPHKCFFPICHLSLNPSHFMTTMSLEHILFPLS